MAGSPWGVWTCWATPSWEGEESWAGNAILNAPGWGTARIRHTTFSFRFSLPPLSLLPTPANSPHPDSTTPNPSSLRSPQNPGARGLRAPAARYHLRNYSAAFDENDLFGEEMMGVDG